MTAHEILAYAFCIIFFVPVVTFVWRFDSGFFSIVKSFFVHFAYASFCLNIVGINIVFFLCLILPTVTIVFFSEEKENIITFAKLKTLENMHKYLTTRCEKSKKAMVRWANVCSFLYKCGVKDKDNA